MFVWEKIAWILWVLSITNCTCPNRRPPGDQTRHFGIQLTRPPWFELGSFEVVPLFRSQTDFRLFYRYLIATRLFRNPATRSLFHWFSRGTICRIGWSYRARCKQKGKRIPPGTSSLAIGQSCYMLELRRGPATAASCRKGPTVQDLHHRVPLVQSRPKIPVLQWSWYSLGIFPSNFCGPYRTHQLVNKFSTSLAFFCSSPYSLLDQKTK